jgi:ribosomal protein L11 methyltransferase
MVELLLLAPQDAVESVSDALIDELGALSASVEDADADTDAEQALFGEPGLPAPAGGWQHSRVIALFVDEAAATQAATLLLAQEWARDVALVALRPVADQDWVRLTQSQFAPVEISPAFWIVPSWHAVPPGAQRVIRLDPGLAFGTGTHPTTRMCLRWTAREAGRRADGWTRVLDYGCGSGILAIGAALHGARHIDAVDIPGGGGVHARQCPGQRCNRERGTAGTRAWHLPPGVRQYPRHAAQAARAAALRSRGSRRQPGVGRHPAAAGRRASRGLLAMAHAAGGRQRRRLGADDGRNGMIRA